MFSLWLFQQLQKLNIGTLGLGVIIKDKCLDWQKKHSNQASIKFMGTMTTGLDTTVMVAYTRYIEHYSYCDNILILLGLRHLYNAKMLLLNQDLFEYWNTIKTLVQYKPLHEVHTAYYHIQMQLVCFFLSFICYHYHVFAPRLHPENFFTIYLLSYQLRRSCFSIVSLLQCFLSVYHIVALPVLHYHF